MLFAYLPHAYLASHHSAVLCLNPPFTAKCVLTHTCNSTRMSMDARKHAQSNCVFWSFVVCHQVCLVSYRHTKITETVVFRAWTCIYRWQYGGGGVIFPSFVYGGVRGWLCLSCMVATVAFLIQGRGLFAHHIPLYPAFTVWLFTVSTQYSQKQRKEIIEIKEIITETLIGHICGHPTPKFNLGKQG